MRKMTLKQWEKCEKKWIGIKAGILKKAKLYIDKNGFYGRFNRFKILKSCSFCDTYSTGQNQCPECPLYVDNLCANNQNNKSELWRLLKYLSEGKYAPALKACDAILKGIREHKPEGK